MGFARRFLTVNALPATFRASVTDDGSTTLGSWSKPAASSAPPVPSVSPFVVRSCHPPRRFDEDTERLLNIIVA